MNTNMLLTVEGHGTRVGGLVCKERTEFWKITENDQSRSRLSSGSASQPTGRLAGVNGEGLELVVDSVLKRHVFGAAIIEGQTVRVVSKHRGPFKLNGLVSVCWD